MMIDHARGDRTTQRWLLYDGHGNLVRTMSPNYILSGWQWRGVWGERETGNSSLQKGYCANLGHPEDEPGLVYMRARYYEPATGRFISEDPSRDGVNWYLYADGNPVNKVNDTGRKLVFDQEVFDRIFYGISTSFGLLFAQAAFMAALLGATASGGDKAFFYGISAFFGYTAIVLLALNSLGISEYNPNARYVTAVHGVARGLMGMITGILQASGSGNSRLMNGFAMAATLATITYGFVLLAMAASIGIDAAGGE